MATLFELSDDEWLVFLTMHYRWNYKRYNLIYIINAFVQIGKAHWPKAIRWLGGIKLALKYGKVPGFMLGIGRSNTAALEIWTGPLLDKYADGYQVK